MPSPRKFTFKSRSLYQRVSQWYPEQRISKAVWALKGLREKPVLLNIQCRKYPSFLSRVTSLSTRDPLLKIIMKSRRPRVLQKWISIRYLNYKYLQVKWQQIKLLKWLKLLSCLHMSPNRTLFLHSGKERIVILTRLGLRTLWELQYHLGRD